MPRGRFAMVELEPRSYNLRARELDTWKHRTAPEDPADRYDYPAPGRTNPSAHLLLSPARRTGFARPSSIWAVTATVAIKARSVNGTEVTGDGRRIVRLSRILARRLGAGKRIAS